MNKLTLTAALISFPRCLSLTCHWGNNPHEISMVYNYSYKSYVSADAIGQTLAVSIFSFNIRLFFLLFELYNAPFNISDTMEVFKIK